MMNLAEYRKKSASLADYLPWAALVAPGVVLNKDGSFQRTARFRGPDLDSSTPAELVGATARLNSVLRRLGSGWAIFVEAQRNPTTNYPNSQFPDSASALLDLERREQFEDSGALFESTYFLTFVWLPPAEEASRIESWLYEGREKSGVDPWELLKGFVDRTDRVLNLVEGFVPEAAWLDDGETLTYLHSTISTKRLRVRVPETPSPARLFRGFSTTSIGLLSPTAGQRERSCSTRPTRPGWWRRSAASGSPSGSPSPPSSRR
jgi:type IV secretion system protein VirB4